MCDCGCNDCGGSKPVMLNESIAPKEILSEGLKYHMDNDMPLTEHVYRAGSQKYFELWAEARALYTRGILEVTDNDLEVLTETDLGHFGMFEGKKVPLDFPIELTETELNEMDNMSMNEVTRYSGFNRNPEDPDSEPFQPTGSVAKFREDLRALFGKFKDDLKNPEFIKGVAEIMVNWKALVRSQLDENKKLTYNDFVQMVRDDMMAGASPDEKPSEEQVKKKAKAYYNDYLQGASVDSLFEAKKKAKKNNKKLNKPMRDSSGGKAYKVYVKDPKTKKIKTVRFGSGGLRAKINDKKARNAFAKRHKCSTKKDKTKAGYWSCRLPRYAKLLGLKSNFGGFW
jgi:hypothetical protein